MAEYWEAELCGAGTVAELDDLARLAGWSTSGIFCVNKLATFRFFCSFCGDENATVKRGTPIILGNVITDWCDGDRRDGDNNNPLETWVGDADEGAASKVASHSSMVGRDPKQLQAQHR